VSGAAQIETVRAAQRRAAHWPYEQLDIAALRRRGWLPTPIRDVVLKVHQRCNLACDYCYVYTHADQSWRDRPAVMPDDVWRAAISGLRRHVRRHQIPAVRLILHGGEPLLFGADNLGRIAVEARTSLSPDCTVDVGLQTNGVLLSGSVLDQLRPHHIKIGISVDGVAADHDRHRVTATGRGSFVAVRRALELLRKPENRQCYAGILCTIAPDTDPIATYEQLLAFEPPTIDFLLPHANWQVPPWKPTNSSTPYADWLSAVFDRWYTSADSPSVRLFDDIVTLLLGGHSSSEQVGLSPSAVIVVESDGFVEQVDALKSAYDGACAMGLDVRRDELDLVLEDPGIVARQIGRAALADQCLACPVHPVCGAGHYAHRYRSDVGFRNPSVYCEDLRKLIDHIRLRVAADVQRLT
jgi:uncharacterized protein